jgi:hypothetical protein
LQAGKVDEAEDSVRIATNPASPLRVEPFRLEAL